MAGGLITIAVAIISPILMWFQEQYFLLNIMRRLFFFNGEDLNTLNPPEKRMLRRVMKLKAKKEVMNSSFQGEFKVEDSVPDLSQLESISDLSSVQASTVLS